MFTQKQKPRRYAFVLGIADYNHSAKLANTIADATAIAKALTNLGFNVEDHYDLDYKNLCFNLKKFLAKADGADTIVVYYAGHGIQLGNENFIVPKDFDPYNEYPVTAMVPIHPLLDEMAKRADKKLLFLDACRDDGGIRPRRTQVTESIAVAPPAHAHEEDGFLCASQLCIEPHHIHDGSPTRTRSLVAGKGLARPRLTENNEQTFLAFAADPGAYALDGPQDGNSPFTAAVLRNIHKRGLDVFDMCQRVARDVRTHTNGEQVPWTNSNLIDNFEFHIADNRPVWIMTALGALAGLGTALCAFDLLNFSFKHGIEYGTGQLIDITTHPQFLITSLFFGIAAAIGTYTWGRKTWWAAALTCAIYTVFAIASRILFAPVVKAQNDGKLLDELGTEKLTGVLFGKLDLGDPNASFLFAVLFMAILGGGLTGVGSIVSAAPFNQEFRRAYRIVLGSAIGSSAALIFLGFLILRQATCDSCDSFSDGFASPLDIIGTIVLVAMWQGALAANIGLAYAHPRYDDS